MANDRIRRILENRKKNRPTYIDPSVVPEPTTIPKPVGIPQPLDTSNIIADPNSLTQRLRRAKEKARLEKRKITEAQTRDKFRSKIIGNGIRFSSDVLKGAVIPTNPISVAQWMLSSTDTGLRLQSGGFNLIKSVLTLPKLAVQTSIPGMAKSLFAPTAFKDVDVLKDNPALRFIEKKEEELNYLEKNYPGEDFFTLVEKDRVAAADYLYTKVLQELPRQMIILSAAMMSGGSSAVALNNAIMSTPAKLAAGGAELATTGGFMTLAGMGTLAASDKLQQNSAQRGYTKVEDIFDATMIGVIEAGFENFGTFGVVKKALKKTIKIGGRNAALEVSKRFIMNMISATTGEANEEFLTSLAQDFVDYSTGINPNITMNGSVMRALEAGIVGGIMGSVITAPSATSASQVDAKDPRAEIYESLLNRLNQKTYEEELGRSQLDMNFEIKPHSAEEVLSDPTSIRMIKEAGIKRSDLLLSPKLVDVANQLSQSYLSPSEKAAYLKIAVTPKKAQEARDQYREGQQKEFDKTRQGVYGIVIPKNPTPEQVNYTPAMGRQEYYSKVFTREINLAEVLVKKFKFSESVDENYVAVALDKNGRILNSFQSTSNRPDVVSPYHTKKSKDLNIWLFKNQAKSDVAEIYSIHHHPSRNEGHFSTGDTAHQKYIKNVVPKYVSFMSLGKSSIAIDRKQSGKVEEIAVPFEAFGKGTKEVDLDTREKRASTFFFTPGDKVKSKFIRPPKKQTPKELADLKLSTLEGRPRSHAEQLELEDMLVKMLSDHIRGDKILDSNTLQNFLTKNGVSNKKFAVFKKLYKKSGETAVEFLFDHLRPEIIIEGLVDFQYGSTLHRIVMQPLLDARAAELVSKQTAIQTIQAIHKDVNLSKAITYKYNVAGFQGMTKNTALFIYAHSKNKNSRRHLKSGGHLTDVKIKEIVASLSEQDRTAVDLMHDYYKNDVYPVLNGVYSQVKGKPLGQEDFYFPIKNLGQLQDKSAIEAIEMELGGKGQFVKIQPKDSMTKERSKHANEAFTDFDYLGTIYKHLNDVEHYINFAVPLKTTSTIFKTQKIKSALKAKHGTEHGTYVSSIFDKWLKDLAHQGDQQAKTVTEKIVRGITTNTMAAIIGLNLSIAQKQTLSFFNGIHLIGATDGLLVLTEALTDLWGIVDFAESSDPVQKNRRRFLEREIATIYQARGTAEITGGLNIPQRVKEESAILTRFLDRITSALVWKGAYNKVIRTGKIEGKDVTGLGLEDAAKEYASWAVRNSQPMGHHLDLPAISRGNAFQKLLTRWKNQRMQNIGMSYRTYKTMGGEKSFGWKFKEAGSYAGFALGFVALLLGLINRRRLPTAGEFSTDILEQLISGYVLIGDLISVYDPSNLLYSVLKRGQRAKSSLQDKQYTSALAQAVAVTLQASFGIPVHNIGKLFDGTWSEPPKIFQIREGKKATQEKRSTRKKRGTRETR